MREGWRIILLAIYGARGVGLCLAAFTVAAAAVLAVFTDAGAIGGAGRTIFAHFPAHADKVTAFVAVGVHGADAETICACVFQSTNVVVIAGGSVED